jgi:diaminopimelate decarboxylase
VTATHVPLRLALFPTTASIDTSQGMERLTIGGCDLADVARRFGTPLYLYDQATLDAAMETYE